METKQDLRDRIKELEEYSDKLADEFPLGMLPNDIELIKQANAQMAELLQEHTVYRVLIALDDAINSPKGVVPHSASEFYDGSAGCVKFSVSGEPKDADSET